MMEIRGGTKNTKGKRTQIVIKSNDSFKIQQLLLFVYILRLMEVEEGSHRKTSIRDSYCPRWQNGFSSAAFPVVDVAHDIGL